MKAWKKPPPVEWKVTAGHGGLRGGVMKTLLTTGKVCWWQLAMALRRGGNGL